MIEREECRFFSKDGNSFVRVLRVFVCPETVNGLPAFQQPYGDVSHEICLLMGRKASYFCVIHRLSRRNRRRGNRNEVANFFGNPFASREMIVYYGDTVILQYCKITRLQDYKIETSEKLFLNCHSERSEESLRSI